MSWEKQYSRLELPAEDNLSIVKLMIDAAVTRKDRYQARYDNNLSDWTYVWDLVEAHLLAAQAWLISQCFNHQHRTRRSR